MRYLSVCSGIEAATVAWHPLGWEAAAFSEIEKFPRAVLQHRYPDTPLHGDFTTIGADEYGPIDLLVGGTPCQSFSIAGLRGGLADDRGNLALEFLRLAQRTRAKWLVWENVPGVLSSNGGRDFGAILGGMVELGYGLAYRVLDAQFFGVPQRRRRVFVVGHLGDWRRAAAALFERHSLQGHPAPRREAREGITPILEAGARTGVSTTDRRAGIGIGEAGDAMFTLQAGKQHAIASTGEISHCLNAGGMGRQDYETETLIAHSLRGEGFDASEDGTGRGTPLVPVAMLNMMGSKGMAAFEENPQTSYTLTQGCQSGADMHAVCFSAKDHGADAMEDCSPTLRAGGHSKSHANAGVMPAIAYGQAIKTTGHQGDNVIGEGDVWPCLAAQNANNGGGAGAILHATSAVRRLTPRECERLQGFPDTQRTAIVTVCEGEKSDHVRSAPQSSAAPNRAASAPVAVSVLIDLEQERVALRNLDGSSWSASIAEPASSSPLSMPADAFARLAAHTLISLVPVTDAGVEGSLQNSKRSSPLWSGSASVSVSGHEIAALVSDADKFTSEANRLSRFTTSPHGQGTRICAQTLETWSCCVCAAISGFIPEQIRNAPSYTIEVEVRAGFTRIPWRGKPADECPDGPRYKALGNSMAVPVMRWIGERIAAVEALQAERWAS